MTHGSGARSTMRRSFPPPSLTADLTMPLAVIRSVYGLGVLLMLIGLADAALARFANFDLTGKNWSPLAFGIAGIVLMWISRLLPQQEE